MRQGAERVEPPHAVRSDGDLRAVVDRDHPQSIEVVRLVQLVFDLEVNDFVRRRDVNEVVEVGALEAARDGTAECARIEPPIPAIPAVHERAGRAAGVATGTATTTTSRAAAA